MIALHENPRLLAAPDGTPYDRIHGLELELLFRGIIKELVKVEPEQAPDDESYPDSDLTVRIEPAEAALAEPLYRSVTMTPELLLGTAYGKNYYFGPRGERFYIDVGNHPEYCTPEELDFYRTGVRKLHAYGHVARIFDKAANLVADKEGIPKPKFILSNNIVDENGDVWGNHEDILTRREIGFKDFKDAFIAHYVSRIVWSGAGAVYKNVRSPDKFIYQLSIRAEHIWEDISSATTISRPFINTKDEPLADPDIFRRIHGIHGEPTFSPLITALSLASQSILLRACELGQKFDDLVPEIPVQAIRKISRDPTLKSKVRLNNGQECTGIELQHKLIDRCLQTPGINDYMTSQEILYLGLWQRVLEVLENDPHSDEGRKLFDWVVKQEKIYESLDEPVERKSGKNTAYDIAWRSNMAYHVIHPVQGVGLRQIINQEFESSPSADVLKNGLALPPTRAFLRGEAIRRMLVANIKLSADWYNLKIPSITDLAYMLRDPYAIADDRVESMLRAAGVRFR